MLLALTTCFEYTPRTETNKTLAGSLLALATYSFQTVVALSRTHARFLFFLGPSSLYFTLRKRITNEITVYRKLIHQYFLKFAISNERSLNLDQMEINIAKTMLGKLKVTFFERLDNIICI